MKEYNGDLKGFPEKAVNAMLKEQVAQGNKEDVAVFEGNRIAHKGGGGFDWSASPRGFVFWNKVIVDRNFDLIPDEPQSTFKPMPEKVMYVSDYSDFRGKSKRVVFGTKVIDEKKYFLAWNGAETIEEAKGEYITTTWPYAKDIEPELSETQKKLKALKETQLQVQKDIEELEKSISKTNQ